MSTIDLHVSDVSVGSNKLRSVDTDCEEYKELKNNIGVHGVLNIISIRKAVEADAVETDFVLCDGGHRLQALKELFEEGSFDGNISAKLLTHDRTQDVIIQMSANVHRIESKPAEYSRAVKTYLAENPEVTAKELAKTLSKDPSWLSKLIGISTHLPENVQEMVDAGEIPFTKATVLANAFKEDSDGAQALVEVASNPDKTLDDLAKETDQVVRAARAERKKGSFVYTAPEPSFRTAKEIRAMAEAEDTIFSKKVLAWLTCMDKATLAADKAKWVERTSSKLKTKYRGALIRRCEKEGIPYLPKQDFDELMVSVKAKNEEMYNEFLAKVTPEA